MKSDLKKKELRDCEHCGEKIIWWGSTWAHNQGKVIRDHKAEPMAQDTAEMFP